MQPESAGTAARPGTYSKIVEIMVARYFEFVRNNRRGYQIERHAEPLSALGHPVRLAILRLVVQGGADGVAAGQILLRHPGECLASVGDESTVSCPGFWGLRRRLHGRVPRLGRVRRALRSWFPLRDTPSNAVRKPSRRSASPVTVCASIPLPPNSTTDAIPIARYSGKARAFADRPAVTLR